MNLGRLLFFISEWWMEISDLKKVTFIKKIVLYLLLLFCYPQIRNRPHKMTQRSKR